MATNSSILAGRIPWTDHGVAKNQIWLSDLKKKQNIYFISFVCCSTLKILSKCLLPFIIPYKKTVISLCIHLQVTCSFFSLLPLILFLYLFKYLIVITSAWSSLYLSYCGQLNSLVLLIYNVFSQMY